MLLFLLVLFFFFFKQKTAYEMRISDWSSDVCSSDLTGVTVTGFDFGHNSEAVAAVETDRGRIACEQIVIGTGPWVRDFWDVLDLPKKIAVKGRDGVLHDDVPMWRYWQLEEGVLGVEPGQDRKRGVVGRSMSVRVNLGGPRFIKKTKTHKS